MKRKKILILGSYPIVNPQHGGQKRSEAIVAAYKKNFSKVQYAAIFYKGFESDFSRHDIAVSKHTVTLIDKQPNFSDIYCGEAAFSDPAVKQKITKLLHNFNPDIIHVEQPYIYLGLKPLLRELELRPKLIFGSQNIEYKMKQEIYHSLEIEADQLKQAVRKIRQLETDFAKDSDLLVAVSQEDMTEHKAMGAKRIVLAANGITESTVRPRKHVPRPTHKGPYTIDKKILFIGSAHPPNWFGFEKMVGTRLGFIPSRARIYLIGGVSEHFVRTVKRRTAQDITFWQRAIAYGRVSEKKLAELLATSDVIILPITEGGGSNLKTAEAFVADKKIVATKYALRSYEYLSGLPNLFIADTPQQFRKAILHALDTKHQKRSSEEQQLVRRVLWENCLSGLIKEVESL